jgi:hypothetical protein
VLSTDLEYGGLDLTWEHVCGDFGARYVRTPIRPPVTNPEEIVEAIWAGVGPRTRAIFISHHTSATAITLPVEELCRRARAAGITTTVDGAHMPGHLPLNLRELDADHYAGNWPQVAVPFLRIRSSDTGWVDDNRVSCASVRECPPSDGWLEVLRARLRGHRPKRDQERSEIERSERRHRSAQARTPEGKPGKNRERDHD